MTLQPIITPCSKAIRAIYSFFRFLVKFGTKQFITLPARRTRSDLFIAEFDEKTKKERDCPYGLATGGNNWLEGHKISEPIKFGVIDEKNIINDF